MTAPSLPEAAEIPWAVVRYRVGKTSPGTINYDQQSRQTGDTVVVFAPKFIKN